MCLCRLNRTMTFLACLLWLAVGTFSFDDAGKIIDILIATKLK